MDSRIAGALRILDASLSDELSIASVAASVGLSLHHFHRLFLDEMNETPAGYLRRIRMDGASARLRWTDDSVATVADRLGYRSPAAFTRAFEKRFGETPLRYRRRFMDAARPQPGERKVAVREMESFRVLARRYRGDLLNMISYWEDFLGRLPPTLQADRQALYLGILYDDPRQTPPEHQRYDCCITVPSAFADDTGALVASGLHVMETRAGLYGCIRQSGPWEGIADTYFYMFDQWVVNSRYRMSDDPIIEIHAVPRNHMPPGNVVFTILVAVD